MEYILIFISAIFVNNIVLSQFLGICPFLGVSKKIDTALGMSAAVAFVLTLSTIHRRLGADGRNHLEESVSLALSGVGRVPSVDYDQLLCVGCCHLGYPERL